MEVTTNAVQIFGGYGYMKEYPIEKYARRQDHQIYEGTSESARRIGRGLIAAAARAVGAALPWAWPGIHCHTRAGRRGRNEAVLARASSRYAAVGQHGALRDLAL